MSELKRTPLPSAPGARRPVHHRSAGEVPARLNEGCARNQLVRLAVPEADVRRRTSHKVTVRLVQIDRCVVERLTPVVHRGVEVRVRDRDGLDSSQAVDDLHRRLVDVRGEVPKDVPVLRLHEYGSLTDSEFRLRPNADDVRLMLTKYRESRVVNTRQRCPLLTTDGESLPLINTTGADLRWFDARGVLGPTRDTDECFHFQLHCLNCGLVFVRVVSSPSVRGRRSPQSGPRHPRTWRRCRRGLLRGDPRAGRRRIRARQWDGTRVALSASRSPQHRWPSVTS